MKGKMSVIIPAFNEELGIAGVIRDVKQHFEGSGYSYEIIVVNDASKDQTEKIAHDEGVKVISHQKNKGYGASLKTGIKNATGEFIALIDADGTYKGEDLLKLSEYMQENDMVSGARVKPKVLHESFLRTIAKFFLRKLASYLSETDIPDFNCGLRIIRKDKVGDFLRILPNRFSFTTTITLAFLSNNLRVHFVPVDAIKRRGTSKIRPLHDTLNFAQLIIRTIMYFNPLKVFVPASLFFFFAGIAVLLYSRLFLMEVMDVTVVVLILASFQILAIGMVADLIVKKWN